MMKVTLSVLAAIPNTNYFLEGTITGAGIARWNVNINSKYAKRSILNVPPFVTFTDLKIISNTKYSVGTLSGWKQLFVLDFVSMEVLYQFENAYGFIDYLSKDPKKTQLVLAQENNLKLYSYSEGQYSASISTEYYINAVKSIPESTLVVVANSHFLRVYDIDNVQKQSVKPYIYSYRAKDSVLDVDFSHKTGQLYFSGNGFVSSLFIDKPRIEQCFDFCSGCEYAFTKYGCQKCTPLAVKKDLDAKIVKFGDSETEIDNTVSQEKTENSEEVVLNSTPNMIVQNTNSTQSSNNTVQCVQKQISTPPSGFLDSGVTYSIDSEIAFIPGFTRRLWFYLLSILVLCVTVFVCGWYAYKMSCRKSPIVKYTDGIGTRSGLVKSGVEKRSGEQSGGDNGVVMSTDRDRLNTQGE